MEQNFLTRAHHVLADMRDHVVRAVRADLLERSEEETEKLGDVNDAAADERERELRVLLKHRDREKLNAIEEALARIDDGSYGVCESCEEEIEEGRLELLPFTRLCVTCQARSERDRAQQRPREPVRVAGDLTFGDADDD